jgi:VanZ family protein
LTRIRPYIPALIWMAAIFMLSTPFFSSALTKGILSRILDFFDFQYTSSSLESTDFLVRKSAHVTVYAILAVLWFRGLIKGSRMSIAKAAVTVLAISVLWAASDEFHQYLEHSQRTAKVSDVMLDSTAAALSLAVIGPLENRKKKNAALRRRFETYYKDRKLNF